MNFILPSIVCVETAKLNVIKFFIFFWNNVLLKYLCFLDNTYLCVIFKFSSIFWK